MVVESYRPKRTFNVDEANAMLPLVRAIAGDMVRVARDLYERQQRVDHLKSGRELDAGDPYSDELAQSELELEQDKQTLFGYMEELRQLGVEPKGPLEGLVDFPCVRDGRLVYLCWRYDEPEVTHWHELDAGFTGRQSLVEKAVAVTGVKGDMDSSLGD